MNERARIASALAGVEGVKAYPEKPNQIHPGAAWPVLREVNRDGTLTGPFTRTYDVFYVLPAGYAPSTADAAEDVIEALVDVLEDVGEWQQPAEPVQIAFENDSTVPGIRVRITPDPE